MKPAATRDGSCGPWPQKRLRPYAEQEAAAFLRQHQALRWALPRHRDELEEMAAPAR